MKTEGRSRLATSNGRRCRNVFFALSTAAKTNNGQRYHRLLDARRPDALDVSGNPIRCLTSLYSSTQKHSSTLPKNVSGNRTNKTSSGHWGACLFSESSTTPSTDIQISSSSSSSSCSSRRTREESSSSGNETSGNTVVALSTMRLDEFIAEQDETVMVSNRNVVNHQSCEGPRTFFDDTTREDDANKAKAASSCTNIKMNQKDTSSTTSDGKMSCLETTISLNLQKASLEDTFPKQTRYTEDKKHTAQQHETKSSVLPTEVCHTNGPSVAAYMYLAEQRPTKASYLDHETTHKIHLWRKAKRNATDQRAKKEQQEQVAVGSLRKPPQPVARYVEATPVPRAFNRVSI